MAEKSVLNKKELAFLQELQNQRIPFMVVGLTAAILQGAPLSTQDLDLWFKNLSDSRIAL